MTGKVIDISSRFKARDDSKVQTENVYCTVENYSLPSDVMVHHLDLQLDLIEQAALANFMDGYSAAGSIHYLSRIVREIFRGTFISHYTLCKAIVRHKQGEEQHLMLEIKLRPNLSLDDELFVDDSIPKTSLYVYFDRYEKDEKVTFGFMGDNRVIAQPITEYSPPGEFAQKLISNINNLVMNSDSGGGADVANTGGFFAVLPYSATRVIRIELDLVEMYNLFTIDPNSKGPVHEVHPVKAET